MGDPVGTHRRAGVVVPLFSIPSSGSWGIGEIADLPLLADWMRGSGLSVVQLLPVNEMADGQTSPYSAQSAMAIDPIFIALRDVPDFLARGGMSSLEDEEIENLVAARASRSVDYRVVRELKNRCLRDAFDMFWEREWSAGTDRGAALRAYIDRERWWLDDYALFRALHTENGGRPWSEWQPGVRNREPGALTAARLRLARDILYHAFLQWVAGEQWSHARAACTGIAIFGDFPFMVSGDSADVWARQHEFRMDASVGVPPDAFSETGQDWGLPIYRWDVHEQNGDEWIRMRARRSADLFDGFRVDHLVGFFRTFVRERDGHTYFVPSDEPTQRAQGERILRALQDAGAELVAEDLGVVPEFVRESLAAMGVPGLKVLRWEREWHAAGQAFLDPAAFPVLSVAMTGTHDTETLAEWWANAEGEERTRATELPAFIEAAITADETFSNRVRDALLETLFGTGSRLALMPMQDIFGWPDRINVPAVVSDENWSWRLPWPVDEMLHHTDPSDRATFLERLAQRTARVNGGDGGNGFHNGGTE
ncbi:MAG: 4-alpha-glucanotransferase [Acidobacteria bacterium]|nr:4-alpha-glucanotransferase [Acidobacteriota bacterium]